LMRLNFLFAACLSERTNVIILGNSIIHLFFSFENFCKDTKNLRNSYIFYNFANFF
jgi:hypothetical protein